MANRFDLENRTALITGGAGLLGPQHGIGLALFGSRVILVDIHEPHLELAKERILSEVRDAKVDIYKCDICDEEGVLKLHHLIAQSGQHVDILVNNAALNPKMGEPGQACLGSLEEYDIQSLQHEISVGLIGSVICSKIFGSAMAKRGNGVLIHIASDLAIIAPDHRIYSETERIEDVTNFKPVGYSIVKSSLLGLSRYLATYWAHKGVRSNCLVPGGVFNNQPEPLVRNICKRVPLQRMAESHEYREALAFLASDASSYMTGQQLVIDGGRSCW
ncbi:MAG: SDR family oxidoreductase [Deltaproteobacteria bacterium]|nr:SDR family oxidoreductase [Deltaproteobacteria bacterium]